MFFVEEYDEKAHRSSFVRSAAVGVIL